MKRQSLKLQDADWFWLGQIADDTGSRYAGKASWRRLIARIARGELVVVAASQGVSQGNQAPQGVQASQGAPWCEVRCIAEPGRSEGCQP